MENCDDMKIERKRKRLRKKNQKSGKMEEWIEQKFDGVGEENKREIWELLEF